VVLVHHPVVFLEETIVMFEDKTNRDELRKQLPFLFEICNGRWFRLHQDIWQIELVQNLGPLANVFLREKERKVLEADIRRGVFSDGHWADFHVAVADKNVEREKQGRLFSIQKEMRQEIAKKRKELNIPKHQKSQTPIEFIRTQLDEWGAQMIERFIDRKNKRILISMWRRNKQRYPFLTSSLEGQIFSDWYAMVEHNKKIDRNAHVDVELLSSLNKADAIVTADTKFLRDAFEVLWRPRGKQIYSPEDFVEHLKLLSN